MSSLLVLKNASLHVGCCPGEIVSIPHAVSKEDMDNLDAALKEEKDIAGMDGQSSVEIVIRALNTVFGEGNWAFQEFYYKYF